MTFKIALNPTFKAQVEVNIKNDKGIFEKSICTARFERTNTDELDELRKLPQAEVVRKKLVGWESLVGDNNETVEFNEINLDAVMKIPEAVFGFAEAFWTSIYKQKEKN